MLKNIGFMIASALILGGIVWYQVSIWNECRATNSFVYCFHVLGR